jgi:filamentous hemagglutinin
VHNKCGLPSIPRWAKGSFDSPEDSFTQHFRKHGQEVGASTYEEYYRKAVAFAENLRGARKVTNIPGDTPNVTRYYKNGRYIDLTPDKKIISFGRQ